MRGSERAFSSESKSMAVAGTHTTANQANLGTLQLNSATCGVHLHQWQRRRAHPAVQVLPRRGGLNACARCKHALCDRRQGPSQAARGLRVLTMAYAYDSIETSTSTHNTSAPSPAPSHSLCAQPMSQ